MIRYNYRKVTYGYRAIVEAIGDDGEEYADEEILEIRITGAAVKSIKAALAKAGVK